MNYSNPCVTSLPGPPHAGGSALLPEGHAPLRGRLEHSALPDPGVGGAERFLVTRVRDEVDPVAFR